MDESLVLADSSAPSVARPAIGPLAGLLTLAGSHFLIDGASTYLPGVLPAVLADLHIPLRLVGTIMAALLVGQALQPAFGWIADNLGGRGFVICGVIGSATGGALVGLVPGFWSLIGALLLIGFSAAMFHPQALAGVRLLPGNRTGVFMSIFLLGGLTGQAIWPLAASLIVSRLGLHALPLLAVPAALSLPLLFSRTPAQPRRHPDLPHGNLLHALPSLAALVCFVSLESTVQYSVVTFMPILWVHHGGSLVGGASLITVMLGAGLAGNVLGGHLSDRVGRRKVMLFSGTAAAIFIAMLTQASGSAMWFLLGGIGIALYSSNPAQILVGQDL